MVSGEKQLLKRQELGWNGDGHVHRNIQILDGMVVTVFLCSGLDCRCELTRSRCSLIAMV